MSIRLLEYFRQSLYNIIIYFYNITIYITFFFFNMETFEILILVFFTLFTSETAWFY